MKLFLLTAAAVLATAPVAAMPHHAKNIRTPHIHRAMQRNTAPNIHQRVAAFNDHARKQINSNNNSWRYVSHCAGYACSFAVQY